MKKLGIILGSIILGLVLLVLLFFISLKVINTSALKKEQKEIVPYGQEVKVDGKSMRVQILGQGDRTLVLLPGYLTGSPVIDFKPLTDELLKEFKVVVVEPFGYGLSEDTAKERTIENLTEELHDALSQLGMTHYSLIGHSISGVYSLDYITKYPDEVESFIGIDSSLPSQEGADDNPTGTLRFLGKSGLYRQLVKASPEMLSLPPVEDKLAEQFTYISLKNMGNKATMAEGEEMTETFEKTKKLSYPKDLPVLYFLASESVEPDDKWLPIHEDMLKDSMYSDIKIYEGSHYLHHTKSEEMAKDISEFLKKTK